MSLWRTVPAFDTVTLQVVLLLAAPRGGFHPFQSQGTMDFSSFWNTGTIVGALGGAIAVGVKALDLRMKLSKAKQELEQAKDEAQARHATAVRAARDTAFGLEAFAHACYALLTENTRADLAGDLLTYRLPSLAAGVRAGNSDEALELESAYRDLEVQVRSANDHINETFRDDYNAGRDEALAVLEARAYETAASALKLANRYRTTFKVPRTRLSGREHRIEAEILTRADEEDAA
ncbi:hypothetical protein [Burkholderia cenocepacia]|uniref:hypothetical protein n=1 Tax=Burkholderia cenocepacia TaxID=95486 RepID=UPI0022325E86|nr:hypothetical protein [Burkholderia cenocepacia]MCW3609156.1 hypothetical protein [Burkholderia cenocepacia]MCW5189880.1 hypothetical protein [Burkholderia cenocepacia]